MKTTILTTLAIISFTISLTAADAILAANVQWKGPFGVSNDQKDVFNLMACGYFQGPTSPELSSIVAAWLRDHPKATVVPVASSDIDPEKRPGAKMVYVWIIDGGNNLNLELVSQGCFVPGSQTIIQKNELGLPEQKLEAPQADYDAFAQKALEVGKQAKEKKLGIWKTFTEPHA